MWAIIHKKCKGVAFEYLVIPKSGELIRAEWAYYRNRKRQPREKEEIICDSCGEKFTQKDAKIWNVKELDEYKNPN